MNILRSNQIVSRTRKHLLRAQELVFIGHVVSKNGIKPDPDNIKVLSKMPHSQDQSKHRNSLRMVADVRWFIPNCEELSAPLSAITSNKHTLFLDP